MTKALLDPSGPINAGAQRPLQGHGAARQRGQCAPARGVRRHRRGAPRARVARRGHARHGDSRPARRRSQGCVEHHLDQRAPSRARRGFSVRRVSRRRHRRHRARRRQQLHAQLRRRRHLVDPADRGAGERAARCASSGWRCARIPAGRAVIVAGWACSARSACSRTRRSSRCLSDKNVIPPYGVRNGWTGAPNRFTVVRDGKEIEPSPLPGKVTGFALRAGDVVDRAHGGRRRLRRSAGARSRKRWRATLRFGYVSAEGRAEARVRWSRSQRRAARVRVASHAAQIRGARAPQRCASRRSSAQRLGVADGDLVEVVRDDGPSLLGWVEIADVAADACAFAAPAAFLLGLAHGDRVTLRRMRNGDDRPGCIAGVDVGGTFTDVVMFDARRAYAARHQGPVHTRQPVGRRAQRIAGRVARPRPASTSSCTARRSPRIRCCRRPARASRW